MAYPFDESGILPSNLVREQKSVTNVNGIDHNYVIPEGAPFHGASMVVYHKETARYLEKDVDYYLTHIFEEASDAIGRSIHSGVTFIDKNITGTFNLSYQTIGGSWVNSDTIAVNDGLNSLAALLTIRWEEVVPNNMTFPPTRHTQPVTDIEAVTEIINSMKDLTDAIKSGSRDIYMKDIKDVESAYIQPTLTALYAIVGAIKAKENAAYLTHMYSSPKNILTSLGNVPEGEWIETPLSCTVPRAGSWLISWDVNAIIEGALNGDGLPEGGNLKPALYVKAKINGSDIATSVVNGAIVPLNKDIEVTLHIMLAEESGKVIIANNLFSSCLTMMRVSN